MRSSEVGLIWLAFSRTVYLPISRLKIALVSSERKDNSTTFGGEDKCGEAEEGKVEWSIDQLILVTISINVLNREILGIVVTLSTFLGDDYIHGILHGPSKGPRSYPELNSYNTYIQSA